MWKYLFGEPDLWIPWQPDIRPEAPELQLNADTKKVVKKSDYFVPVLKITPRPPALEKPKQKHITTYRPNAYWESGNGGSSYLPKPHSYWIDMVTGVVESWPIKTLYELPSPSFLIKKKKAKRLHHHNSNDAFVPDPWEGTEEQVSGARLWFRYHGGTMPSHLEYTGRTAPARLKYPVSLEKKKRLSRCAWAFMRRYKISIPQAHLKVGAQKDES